MSKLAGKTARLQIVDRATGGWGHRRSPHCPFGQEAAEDTPRRHARAEARTSLRTFPSEDRCKKCRVARLVDGEIVREFEIELADDPGWWAHLDISDWRGRSAVVASTGSPNTHRIATRDTGGRYPGARRSCIASRSVRSSTFRPAEAGITTRMGWFTQGEYHLYFQHNPYGWNWGNMHWGHAVSRDLVHWEELPIAIYPRQFGDWAFSGSAVVDRLNTSGIKRGEDDLLAAAFTSTGRGECIVFSRDRGRTWTEFSGNPVVNIKAEILVCSGTSRRNDG